MVESKPKFTEAERAAAYKARGFEDKYGLCMVKQCENLVEFNGDKCIFCGVKNCDKLQKRLEAYYFFFFNVLKISFDEPHRFEVLKKQKATSFG